MKIKLYLLQITVAALACISGVAVFSGFSWLASFRAQLVERFSAKTVKAPLTDAEIADIKFQIDEQAKNIPPPAIEETRETDNETPWVFPTGAYYFEEDKLPKGFKDFKVMEIIGGEFDAEADEYVYIPPKGYIETKAVYNFVRISVGARKIAFETEKVGGVSFKFTGEFPENEICGFDGEKPAPDLKGKLIKMKNGKKIAETEVGFYVSCGC